MTTNNKNINLTDLAQDKKLKDLLEFPCDFTFKVVGQNRDGLVEDVINTVQQYAKGDYRPRESKSSKGTYNSISVDIHAQNIEQIETLYAELAKISGVRMVL
ncbi:hypothetical protein EV693_10890 [Nicoletella semolina]|uniref:UPF0250 protein EV693_10890 n=1 Tax=Nicoletella semolina TaxID=271160 RepID=A0A4R2N7V3_9PAST|nr:DUF493 family protein YbeD [Nicoletella semolina]MDH2924671.1 hypothetical protein [Nicoletella semolina]TCP17037.1 hypothetical protein EV693_10890 [Nicoletella semolina]